MQQLILKPSQDGTAIRLHPANHLVLTKHGLLWSVTMDSGIAPDVAGIIFQAFHTLVGSRSLDVNVLCDMLNVVLSGNRLVIKQGCVWQQPYVQRDGVVNTSRCVPTSWRGDCNLLGIYSLLDSLGQHMGKIENYKAVLDVHMNGDIWVNLYYCGKLDYRVSVEVE